MSNKRWEGAVLALDIGGTKIAGAVVTGDGQVISRRREKTLTSGPAAVIDQLTRILYELREKPGSDAVEALGISIPAVLEPVTDLIIWGPNLAGFENVHMREALEERLGLPVFIEYDGHAAVLGEWWRGAGRGFNNVVFTIIGTGIGGGLILDGRLYRGKNRLAGAVGWFAMTTKSQAITHEQPCGQWEYLAAGPGIARRAREGLEIGETSSLALGDLTSEKVFEQARAGDPLAQKIISDTAHIIGTGVANIVSLVNPEIIILGGGVGIQADLILEPIRRTVHEIAQPISGSGVKIEISALREDAGLLGAAYAAFERGGAPRVSTKASDRT